MGRHCTVHACLTCTRHPPLGVVTLRQAPHTVRVIRMHDQIPLGHPSAVPDQRCLSASDALCGHIYHMIERRRCRWPAPDPEVFLCVACMRVLLCMLCLSKPKLCSRLISQKRDSPAHTETRQPNCRSEDKAKAPRDSVPGPPEQGYRCFKQESLLAGSLHGQVCTGHRRHRSVVHAHSTASVLPACTATHDAQLGHKCTQPQRQCLEQKSGGPVAGRAARPAVRAGPPRHLQHSMPRRSTAALPCGRRGATARGWRCCRQRDCSRA